MNILYNLGSHMHQEVISFSMIYPYELYVGSLVHLQINFIGSFEVGMGAGLGVASYKVQTHLHTKDFK